MMRLLMDGEQIAQVAPTPESEIKCPRCRGVVMCDLRPKGGLVCVGCAIKLPFLRTTRVTKQTK